MTGPTANFWNTRIEFMADVLGANRKSVTLAAQALQREGLITYHRGRMQVLDRPGLERASCECYAVVKNHLSGFPGSPPQLVPRNTQDKE
jgi:Mn-dependent DtxR family transcriptional regulator